MYEDGSTQRCNRKEEARLRDGLFAYLQGCRIRSQREMQMLQGRCDIAIGDKEGVRILVEIKIADPIRGVAQLFGYSRGCGSSPLRILAVPRWMNLSDMTCAAMAASNTELWYLNEDGTPFFCLGSPKYLTDLIEPIPHT